MSLKTRLNRSGNKASPCSKPLFILKEFVSLFSTLMLNFLPPIHILMSFLVFNILPEDSTLGFALLYYKLEEIINCSIEFPSFFQQLSSKMFERTLWAVFIRNIPLSLEQVAFLSFLWIVTKVLSCHFVDIFSSLYIRIISYLSAYKLSNQGDIEFFSLAIAIRVYIQDGSAKKWFFQALIRSVFSTLA